ncbi:hypothetical protein Pint_21205 [Pistacia integerrima]|uniref:Uncharacterized protein n=1 Tax=Pistacia integerrima TaxID=434235 RepID=A0ACC0X9Y8_9ROSI|nr:hypothetical protein Pint_21205 [Pistacia integerrima]
MDSCIPNSKLIMYDSNFLLRLENVGELESYMIYLLEGLKIKRCLLTNI